MHDMLGYGMTCQVMARLAIWPPQTLQLVYSHAPFVADIDDHSMKITAYEHGHVIARE